MSDLAAALYDGIVVHSRFGTPSHKLRYALFLALFDIDALPALSQRLRLFSHNRFNLFAFHDRDHLPKDAPRDLTLRTMVEGHLAAAGIATGGGPIRLLTLPRVLGYAFNPLSVYFCDDAEGHLAAILYEVNNTFGERHTYVIPVADDVATVRQQCDKAFYVSPFLDMAMRYDFRVTPPGETVAIAVEGSKDGRRVIAASFSGHHLAFDDRTLLRAFLRRPHVALLVIFGIHWEAFKLWRKGATLRPRPKPPAHSATFVMRREV